MWTVRTKSHLDFLTSNEQFLSMWPQQGFWEERRKVNEDFPEQWSHRPQRPLQAVCQWPVVFSATNRNTNTKHWVAKRLYVLSCLKTRHLRRNTIIILTMPFVHKFGNLHPASSTEEKLTARCRSEGRWVLVCWWSRHQVCQSRSCRSHPSVHCELPQRWRRSEPCCHHLQSHHIYAQSHSTFGC